MTEFKLIGIVPLENCHERFLKNLQIGEKYLFYKDFELVISEDRSKIENFQKLEHSNTNLELYKTKNGKTINVSAIVGKNGCGKSSLIELLFYAIYKISLDKYYIDYTDNIQSNRLEELEDLSTIHKFRSELEELNLNEGLDSNGYKSLFGYYFDLIRKIKLRDSIHIKHNSINKEQEVNHVLNEITNEINQKIINIRNKIESETAFHLTLQNLNVSLLFSINEQLYELNIFENKSVIKNWSTQDDDYKNIQNFNFSQLFYSIAINYSHHSLNSLHSGTWLDALFHKNDGYKTPLVINPMRNDGNFNINKEESLARARLLSNLISARLNNVDDRNLLLNEQQNVIGIHFQLKKAILDKPLLTLDSLKEGMNIEVFLIRKFILNELEIEFDQLKVIPYYHELLDYFVRKWHKILDTYDGYLKIKTPEKAIENSYYVEQIFNYYNTDKSHVTFKIRQVINFFRNHIKQSGEEPWKISETGHYFTPKDLIKHCTIHENDNFSTLQEKLPPSIFEIDFILSDNVPEEHFYFHLYENDWLENHTRFGGLSSGEKQLIHSVQTVIYHLSNLDSIDASDKNRVAYSNVNLIFDEIELYFHPDLQRKFIKYLIDSIERIHLKRITSINILFATHSPFILSDILANSILRLENGRPSKKIFTETFAANIHEILTNDFFMDDGFIGAFAKNYIIELIKEIKALPEKNISQQEFQKFHQKILIINEKFIQHKLIELIESKYETQTDFDYLIRKKQREIDELNKRRNDQDNT